MQSMRAGDPVWVVPYDPAWPEVFRRQAADLRAVLGTAVMRIDHIGSTAVLALLAKPIIDIQISVPDFEPVDCYRLPHFFSAVRVARQLSVSQVMMAVRSLSCSRKGGNTHGGKPCRNSVTSRR